MIEFEKYDAYKQELDAITIDLDTDPASTGVGSINSKIAEVHALKERVAAILTDAIKNVHEREKIHKEADYSYQKKFDKILYEDESIQKMRSDTLRKAAINARISDDYMDVQAKAIDLNDAKGFQKMVQTKFDLLDSANNNISRQITVVDLQLQIGEIERAIGGDGFSGGREIGVKR
jgi:hypothetical protein